MDIEDIRKEIMKLWSMELAEFKSMSEQPQTFEKGMVVGKMAGLIEAVQLVLKHDDFSR